MRKRRLRGRRPDGSTTPLQLQDEDGLASNRLNAQDRLQPISTSSSKSSRAISPAQSDLPRIEIGNEDADMNDALTRENVDEYHNDKEEGEEDGDDDDEGLIDEDEEKMDES
jgi:hypothetical protein